MGAGNIFIGKERVRG